MLKALEPRFVLSEVSENLVKYIPLGRSGVKVSPICLGMMLYGSRKWEQWALEQDEARPLVRRAVELGINYFDTSNNYSNGMSEILTGKFIREFMRRDEVVLATKVYNPVDEDLSVNILTRRPEHIRPNRSGLSRKHIFSAVDASLKRLQVDYIDLYQIHRFDYATPIEETMEALHDVVKAGKARYLGASSMFAWQFAKMQQVAGENSWTPFVSMQNHYNLIYREEEREMNPLCRDQGVALLPWSPLARGFLAARRTPDDEDDSEAKSIRAKTDRMARIRYFRPDDYPVIDALSALSDRRGQSNAQLALAWLWHRGVVAPIFGASKVAQVESAVAAIDISLTPDEMAELEAPYKPHSIVGHS
jgi:aryl-alcohol dehydrogenase-like predicted oxidoreductase